MSDNSRKATPFLPSTYTMVLNESEQLYLTYLAPWHIIVAAAAKEKRADNNR